MLKNALVDYTLDQGVSVNATAWIDQTGAMEESVYLVSSMQLESLRFSEYLNEFGFPEMAIVQVPGRGLGACKSLWIRLQIKKTYSCAPNNWWKAESSTHPPG